MLYVAGIVNAILYFFFLHPYFIFLFCKQYVVFLFLLKVAVHNNCKKQQAYKACNKHITNNSLPLFIFLGKFIFMFLFYLLHLLCLLKLHFRIHLVNVIGLIRFLYAIVKLHQFLICSNGFVFLPRLIVHLACKLYSKVFYYKTFFAGGGIQYFVYLFSCFGIIIFF